MAKAVIISGGTSENSRLNGISDFVENYLNSEGITFDTINVRDLPPADLIYGKYDSPDIIMANAKVEEAEIVIILTPVYKASFTGVLKTYLDLLPQKGLVDKTVLPLVLGGTFGHLLMIDYALKPVLAVLGATTLLAGAYILDTQVERLENQQFKLNTEAEQRLQQALSYLTHEK
ncbi:NADPH-dependent FMN reductase [Bacillus canaveralius]|uniref:NADPH-dependent FMN reductase n=1 Tax=Bacillus canaveralius TaxID=1403243 RepID=UPI000F79C1B2|nr:NADPH-dependent FMN reductase [Bacillus canaveralius]RSK52698.1 FMN reductase (NADPH) [Bacillus canaveralius]